MALVEFVYYGYCSRGPWFACLPIFFTTLIGLKTKKNPISTLIRLSSLISGMAEVIACLAIIPALAKFGRVKIYSGGFILSGILCIIVAAVLWTFGKVIYCQD